MPPCWCFSVYIIVSTKQWFVQSVCPSVILAKSSMVKASDEENGLSRKPTQAWRRHQMETFSALPAICAGNSPVTGEFPAQRPVTRSFDVFCDLRLNKRLSKQSRGWWFETPSCPLWRHCNRVLPRQVNKRYGNTLRILAFVMGICR